MAISSLVLRHSRVMTCNAWSGCECLFSSKDASGVSTKKSLSVARRLCVFCGGSRLCFRMMDFGFQAKSLQLSIVLSCAVRPGR